MAEQNQNKQSSCQNSQQKTQTSPRFFTYIRKKKLSHPESVCQGFAMEYRQDGPFVLCRVSCVLHPYHDPLWRKLHMLTEIPCPPGSLDEDSQL